MTPPNPDETDHEHLIKLRVHMGIALKKLEKLENIFPIVKDNAWWINKIKIAVITISVCGVALGIVKFAFS